MSHESVSGIWVNRFRIFGNSATLTRDKVSVVMTATLALDNLLRLKSRNTYTPKAFVDKI